MIARAWQSGLREIVVIASDPEDAATARILAEVARFRDDWPNLWYTAGLHPHEASRWDTSDPGGGRAGTRTRRHRRWRDRLDYHYDNSPRGMQRTAFADQLAIAHARDLPVVVHSRDAEDDTLDVLRESGIAPARVVMHCFTGSARMLDEAVERGYYVSFSGIATFASFDAAGLVPRVPEDRLLTETDAPYLAPVPHRGRGTSRLSCRPQSHRWRPPSVDPRTPRGDDPRECPRLLPRRLR